MAAASLSGAALGFRVAIDRPTSIVSRQLPPLPELELLMAKIEREADIDSTAQEIPGAQLVQAPSEH